MVALVVVAVRIVRLRHRFVVAWLECPRGQFGQSEWIKDQFVPKSSLKPYRDGNTVNHQFANSKSLWVTLRPVSETDLTSGTGKGSSELQARASSSHLQMKPSINGLGESLDQNLHTPERCSNYPNPPKVRSNLVSVGSTEMSTKVPKQGKPSQSTNTTVTHNKQMSAKPSTSMFTGDKTARKRKLQGDGCEIRHEINERRKMRSKITRISRNIQDARASWKAHLPSLLLNVQETLQIVDAYRDQLMMFIEQEDRHAALRTSRSEQHLHRARTFG